MRVLFCTSNWAGHYFCMVPLGWSLQAAGHEVRVTCPPAQAAAISQAGLVAVPILTSLDMMYVARLTLYRDVVAGRLGRPAQLLHPLTAQPVTDLAEFDVDAAGPEFMADYGAAVRQTYDATLGFAQAWRPDVIVHDVMSEEGAIAARELGVPSVYFAPGLFGTDDEELGLNLTLRDMANAMARGAAPMWSRDDIDHVIDPSPASVLPPVGSARRLPVRFVPYNGPGETPDWAWQRRAAGAPPRVCVLWGRSASGIYGLHVDAVRWAIEAGVAQGAQVILTATPDQVAALGNLPSQVRVLRDFPIQLLLPSCSVLVHHGSDNILLNGAIAGRAQVALSLASDQIVFARRMAATGSVLALDGLNTSAAEVEAAVLAALTDVAYQAAAAELQAEMLSAPPPTRIVDELSALAA